MWSRRAFVAGCARASRAYVPIATLATSSRNAPPSSNVRKAGTHMHVLSITFVFARRPGSDRTLERAAQWPTLVAAGLGSSAFLGYLHLSDRITQPQAECAPALR